MASAARVRANRLNAQKSTGPRTPEGKAVVAQNAVKHGLLAQQVVVRGEDPGAFELYRDRMLDDLGPVGSLEDLLAQRVAHLGWRLRRAEKIERAAYATLEMDYAAREASTPPALRRPQGEDEEMVLARVVVDDFGRGKLLDRLLGYERRIENSLYRTVNELRKQRLLREIECSEYRLGAGEDRAAAQDRVHVEGRTIQTRVNAELRTETPCGVTTNGAESDDEVRQTKPNEGSSGKCEVSSFKQEEGRSPGSELQTSDFTLQTSPETPDGVTTNADPAHRSNVLSFQHSSLCASRQTKPIGAGEDPSHAGPFPQASASPGAPSASFCSVRS